MPSVDGSVKSRSADAHCSPSRGISCALERETRERQCAVRSQTVSAPPKSSRLLSRARSDRYASSGASGTSMGRGWMGCELSVRRMVNDRPTHSAERTTTFLLKDVDNLTVGTSVNCARANTGNGRQKPVMRYRFVPVARTRARKVANDGSSVRRESSRDELIVDMSARVAVIRVCSSG